KGSRRALKTARARAAPGRAGPEGEPGGRCRKTADGERSPGPVQSVMRDGRRVHRRRPTEAPHSWVAFRAERLIMGRSSGYTSHCGTLRFTLTPSSRHTGDDPVARADQESGCTQMVVRVGGMLRIVEACGRPNDLSGIARGLEAAHSGTHSFRSVS